jgi:hypothetical protein
MRALSGSFGVLAPPQEPNLVGLINEIEFDLLPATEEEGHSRKSQKKNS